MQLDLSPAQEAEILRQAAAAGYQDAESYVIDLALNGQELLRKPSAEELAGSLAMIESGMQDARAGRGTPMRQALHEIADELGLRRPGTS